MKEAAISQLDIEIGDVSTRNLMPLLHEVQHALGKLVENDAPTSIDLRSIPLAPGEEGRILHLLGQGEVNARLDILGTSEIIETKYAGVWIVTHYNDNNDVISRIVEITRIPDILCSQTEDMVAARERLAVILEGIQEKI